MKHYLVDRFENVDEDTMSTKNYIYSIRTLNTRSLLMLHSVLNITTSLQGCPSTDPPVSHSLPCNIEV